MYQCDYCDLTSDSEDHFKVFMLHVQAEHPEIMVKTTFKEPVLLPSGHTIISVTPTHHVIVENSL